tara:strand:+ start:699 stop:869 length:171 start_codon:yes stop_codon:yes gene_type:complete
LVERITDKMAESIITAGWILGGLGALITLYAIFIGFKMSKTTMLKHGGMFHMLLTY